jgi:hypothetical protein
MAKMVLGKRQAKVLNWVAINPNNHAYAIHKGLTSVTQGNVNTDVKKLENYGFLVSKKEFASEDYQRTVDKYSCTEKGLLYAISNSTKDRVTILKTYREKYQIFDFLLKLQDKQPKMFDRFLDFLGKSFPYLGQGLDKLIPKFIPFIMSDLASQEEYIDLVAYLLDYNPKYRSAIDSLQKALSLMLEKGKGESA